ncbi:hypothetical protein [Candidatus Coxiella mudrowiae]|uniref:hypothetical protein n=1 Tax=Candidatus Coxiella mudrowiae TaxID=2054173 RepID=UPI001F32649B|nr:hypothetical protein [Candidatus Coxiella mudrowiae]
MNGCILEINAQPERLNLDDVHFKMAKIAVKMAILTDAHTINQINYLEFEIDVAHSMLA